MDSPVTFGEWLRQRRSRLRLTRQELAECVGCSVSTLRKIEDDERRPSKQIAELIANCLNIPAADHPTFVKVARGEIRLERLFPPAASIAGSEISPAHAPPQTNLPVLPTPFIGRQREVQELGTLLHQSQCRLLTLIGPGGIGKTRLAIEIASQMKDLFSDGVFFVSLALVNSPRFIVPMLADALGFAFQTNNFTDPKLQLFNYLQGKRALLLTDNLEHLLIEPGIELLAELLGRAPQVKLLVTSREALGLQGEWVFEVQGLPVPESELAEGMMQDTCVELFLQAARRTDAGFTAAAEDYPSIVRICQLVDGMPLGVELAAAWVRTLTCDEIAREIERDLDFLSLSARDMPARHRSMRAVFEHSWKLLSDEEQKSLMRLSVFQGGFRREAAEEVAEANLSLLSSLATKSLLRRTNAGRYEMHEVIRQFAAEQLANYPGLKTQTQERHCLHYMQFFGKEDERLRGPAQREAIAEVTDEIENVRSAWDWAITHGELALIEQSMRSFETFYDMRGWFLEGLDTLDYMISVMEASHTSLLSGRQAQLTLGHILVCRSLLAFRLARLEQARAMLEQSLEILRPLGEPRVLVEALTFRGIVAALMSSYSEAFELFSEGLALAREIGDRWFAALCLTEQIGLDMMMSRSEDDYERFQLAVADWRAIGDPRFTAFGLNFLSMSAFTHGKYEEARIALEESVTLNVSVGDRWGLGTAYRGLGLIAQAQDEHTQALEMFNRSLEIFTQLGSQWEIARALNEMSRSIFALGQDARAEQMWQEALGIAIKTQGTSVALEAVAGLASLHAKRGDLQQSLEWLYFVQGHPASIQDTKNRISKLVIRIAAQLTPQEVEAVQLRAGAKTLDAIVDDILNN